MQGAVPPLPMRLYGVHKGFSLLMIAYMMWKYGIDVSSSRRGPVRLLRYGKGNSCFINRYASYCREIKGLPVYYIQSVTQDEHQSME
jgi:hypothetical protein